MSKELFYQERPLSVFVAPEFVFPDNEFDIEQEFIDKCLTNTPSEAVEDVSSEIHETNRIPDPRILIIDNNDILRLDRVRVDDSIEKRSYLGGVEYEAFEKIKDWSRKNESGVEIWFSPSFEGFYLVEKIDIGEIRYASDGTKILLKKAILLDIGENDFLNIANNFALSIGYEGFKTSEELRSKPIFCTRIEMKNFLLSISELTNQIEMISKGEDLNNKAKNYERLSHFQKEGYIFPDHYHPNDYYYVREMAEQERMMGRNSVSCPPRTVFQSYSGDRRDVEGDDGLGSREFKCPACGYTNIRPFGGFVHSCQNPNCPNPSAVRC